MAIPIGIIASSIYKGISCLLEVIGWDNASTWTPVTLYVFTNGTFVLEATYNLYYNGTGGLIVGSILSTSNTGNPVFNGVTGLNVENSGYYDVNIYANSELQYTISSIGVVTQITSHIA